MSVSSWLDRVNDKGMNMSKKTSMFVAVLLAALASLGAMVVAWAEDDSFSPEFLAELDDVPPPKAFEIAEVRTSPDLCQPVRLEADGEPIDIGKLSRIAHAGPWVADVDGDGDRDLLVGDFPGYFWLFDNQGTEDKPNLTCKGKLQAGGEDAKTPVY